MKNESQYGLLLLQQYLYEHTDDRHPVSVADILAFWQEHGIQAGRKSVYSAIEVLQSNGMDIVCVKSTQNRYFVGERLFELPELKLLVDAVESSRFITAKKSERLIEKLGKLTSESHARQLDRHIYMDGTAKPENECIYYSVDEIHRAGSLLVFPDEYLTRRDQSVLELLHQSHRANTAAPYLVFHIFSSGLEVKVALSTPVPAGIPQTSFLFLSSELQEYAGNAAAFLGFGTAHTEKTHGSQLTVHSSSKHYSRGLLPANPKSE